MKSGEKLLGHPIVIVSHQISNVSGPKKLGILESKAHGCKSELLHAVGHWRDFDRPTCGRNFRDAEVRVVAEKDAAGKWDHHLHIKNEII